MRTHYFVYPGGTASSVPDDISWSSLPSGPAEAAEAVARILEDERVDVLVFWDPRLGPVPWSVLPAFRSSLDDAWHPGAVLTGNDAPDLLRYALPLWIYRPCPPADVTGAINWRIDFRATIVRARAIRALGGLDPGFETLGGTARELGLRLIRRGAICRQRPELLGGGAPAGESSSLFDCYRLLRSQAGAKWTAYGFLRRITEHPTSAVSELRAWRSSREPEGLPRAELGILQRDLETVTLPQHVAVSVVLPTFGRYRYLCEVLDDLRAQTIPPVQILIADGNPPDERDPGVYERYADLPIEVLWHEETGICSGRNACLRRVRGNYVWFVDDDSRFDPRNLELHIRALTAYGADVSVGPAYMPGRPELVPEQRETNCSFMDCGTTLCTRSILEKVGGFDMQFNHYLAGEDNDLGIRFIRTGGLMLNNPFAKRFHYLAPVGGSRSKGSPHVFRRWSLRPRPAQSVYYLARRHFEPAAAWDAVLLAAVTAGWRRKGKPATRGWKLRTLFEELAAIPVTAARLYRSVEIGREMIRQGPQIPSLAVTGERRPAAETASR